MCGYDVGFCDWKFLKAETSCDKVLPVMISLYSLSHTSVIF